MAISPQEKTERGLPLTAADITELLKNPNSWVARLYAECMAIAVIQKAAFIQLVKAISEEEHAYALAEEADRKFADARAEARRLSLINANVPASQTKTVSENAANFVKAGISIATVQAILQAQMATLLAISQTRMNSTQLIEHHQKLTANLSNQLSAQLGNTITLPEGRTLNVPQLSFTTAPSLGQIMTHNPAIADIMLSDATPAGQNALNNIFAQGELIRLAIRKAQEIRNANPDVELTVKERINLANKADKNLHDMLNFDATTKKYEHPLVEKLRENAQLSTQRYVESLSLTKSSRELLSEVSASLSEPPAMFSPYPGLKNSLKPTPGNKKKMNDEHDWIKPRNPTTGKQ